MPSSLKKPAAAIAKRASGESPHASPKKLKRSAAAKKVKRQARPLR